MHGHPSIPLTAAAKIDSEEQNVNTQILRNKKGISDKISGVEKFNALKPV